MYRYPPNIYLGFLDPGENCEYYVECEDSTEDNFRAFNGQNLREFVIEHIMNKRGVLSLRPARDTSVRAQIVSFSNTTTVPAYINNVDIFENGSSLRLYVPTSLKNRYNEVAHIKTLENQPHLTMRHAAQLTLLSNQIFKYAKERVKPQAHVRIDEYNIRKI